MSKKLVFFMGLSLVTVSVMSGGTQAVLTDREKSVVSIMAEMLDVKKKEEARLKRESGLNKNKSSNDSGAQKSVSKKARGKTKKVALIGARVSDDIFEYAYKQDGASLKLLTITEQDRLRTSLRCNVEMLKYGKTQCAVCKETRSNYEKMASHIASQHHEVDGWQQSLKGPFYTSYSGFATSREMAHKR